MLRSSTELRSTSSFALFIALLTMTSRTPHSTLQKSLLAGEVSNLLCGRKDEKEKEIGKSYKDRRVNFSKSNKKNKKKQKCIEKTGLLVESFDQRNVLKDSILSGLEDMKQLGL